jgi:hypothetical protein
MTELTGNAKVDTLIYDIVTTSMNANINTMDRLYEQEKERRQALEVLIEDVLDHADAIWGGTTRDYENMLNRLRRGVPFDKQDEFAARHRENDHA